MSQQDPSEMLDGDIDALLDEAMDIVEEQERQHKEEVRERDSELQNVIDQAAKELSGDNEAMTQMMSDLFANGTGGEGNADFFESFKSQVGQLMSSLDGCNDLSSEDKDNLRRVKEIMKVLDSDDIEKASELLEELQEGSSTNESADDKEVDSAVKRCMEALDSLSKSTPNEALPHSVPAAASSAASAPQPGGARSSASPDASPAPLPENLASMLLGTLLDPQFVEPIRMMRDAYGPWMEDHASEIAPEDREKYELQLKKATEICAFLEVPLKDENDERLTGLLEMMHEFSELGDPPATLSHYTAKVQSTPS